jgi:transcriptional regulator with XRE-family HTH domain
MRPPTLMARAIPGHRSGTMTAVLVRFGQRLRRVRTTKGVSQEKLAELAGLHRTYVSSVERGRCNISLVNIDRLAGALKVPLAKLMP